MADNEIHSPTAGGTPKAAKKVHGRNWLRKRARNEMSWRQRKARSHRYCPPTPGLRNA